MAEDKPGQIEAGASVEKAAKAKKKKAAQTTFTDPKVARRNLYVLALAVLFGLPWVNEAPVIGDIIHQLGLRSYDLLLQANDFTRRTTDPVATSPRHVAVVGIDDPSLERYGRWPWSRSVVADLVLGLKELGASTIAMDVLFAEPQWSPLDGLDELREGLPPGARSPKLVQSLEAVTSVGPLLAELPPEVRTDPVVAELQRRLLPPWEDQLLRKAISEVGNVVLGLVAERQHGAQAVNVWVGDNRSPVAPRNVVNLLREKMPDLTDEDLQEAWDEQLMHSMILGEAEAFPPIRVGRIGDQEVALGDGSLEGVNEQIRASEDIAAVGLTIPLAEFMMAASHAGFMNDTVVKDAVVRRMPLIFLIEDYAVPSLTLAALARYHQADIELELNEYSYLDAIRLVRRPQGGGLEIVTRFECSTTAEVWVNYYGSREITVHRQVDGRDVTQTRISPVIQTIPAYRILDAFRRAPDETDEERFMRDQEQQRLRRLLQGRIVFVGATALGLTDVRSTPLGEFRPGVEAHATVAANALDGSVLRMHPFKEWVLQIFSTFVFMIVLAFLMPRLRPLVAFNFFVVLLVVAYLWCWVCFRSGSILWPFEVILPMTVFFGIGMAYLNLIENKEKAWLDGMFKRYVSPEYVEQIKANKGRLDLNGKEAIITPFFSDMARFSTISESFTAEGLFRFLGEYLGEMADILDEYGGTLDKFEGDAVVAFFGAPIPFEDHAAKACLASLHMHRRIRELEREWQTSDRYPELHKLAEKVGHWFPIRVRIGLNTGPCATGHLGTAERGNYTMMGDTVNLAARLEAAGKQYGISLTISEETYQQAKGVVVARPVDVIQVVGRTVGTPIYEVIAPVGELDEAKERFLALYDSAWGLYRGRDFVEAREAYEEAARLDPTDQVCKIFIERCREYEASPPPEGWDGIHILTAK